MMISESQPEERREVVLVFRYGVVAAGRSRKERLHEAVKEKNLKFDFLLPWNVSK